MRILWTLFKLILALAIAIPLGIIALTVSLGILGALLGIAVLVLKLVCLGFIGYGLFRAAAFFLAPTPTPKVEPTRGLPPGDRYYQEAMREIDAHLGTTPRR